VLKGVRIIYDTWDFDKSRNMHLNYVVVEITPNDYLARLAEVIAQDPEVKIDADRLKEMFLKAVNNK
jgi:hypothetical protein